MHHDFNLINDSPTFAGSLFWPLYAFELSFSHENNQPLVPDDNNREDSLAQHNGYYQT
jgi:hypothetical protein